jgi:hypothetical protein
LKSSATRLLGVTELTAISLGSASWNTGECHFECHLARNNRQRRVLIQSQSKRLHKPVAQSFRLRQDWVSENRLSNMPQQLKAEKERIVYAEWTEVRDDLQHIAAEMTRKDGRKITEAELLRRITLNFVNRQRKKRGEKALDLDPKSGPGGNPNLGRS